MDDRHYMKMALDLAARGRGTVSPNPMVGAILVKNNTVVGKGYHAAAGTPHAEVHAIEDAAGKAAGATLYVSLEPCNHQGRTPPCTERIIHAGISRVVIAMEDPNPHVKGGGTDRLRSRGIHVATGVCEKDARRLNESFIKYVRTGRPFVVIKCAATLDGRIATKTGDAKWVTGEASRKFVHELRHRADGIMVGIDTIKKDDPSLTTRLDDVTGCDPVRVILDTRLSISQHSRVLGLDSRSDTVIIIGENSDVSREKIHRISKTGAQVIEMPLKNGLIDLKAVVTYLGGRGVTSLLVEGGGQVIASALRERIVDKIYFFYAPKIMGGDDAVPICAGPGPSFMRDCISVLDMRVRRFEEDIMVEGYPVWPEN